MNILLPIKDYKFAQMQLDAALPFVLMGVNKVVLLRVIEPPLVQTPRYGQEEMNDEWTHVQERFAEKLLNRTAERIRERCPNAKVAKVIAHGKPLSEVLDTCNTHGIDMIVMGRANKTAWSWLEGSFCQKVAKKAPCRTVILEDHASHQMHMARYSIASF